MGMAIGKHLAAPSSSPLPFPVTGVRPIPFHGLQRLYVAAVIAYDRLLDWWCPGAS
jgi:sarcosine oxidase